MGQMHLQRALDMPKGPATILATDVDNVRLDALRARFDPLAQKCNKRLVISNSANESLHEFVMRETDDCGVDDSIVCVPSAKVMEEAAQVLKHDGMLVLFAGVPNGTFAALNLSDVYLHNAQFTGTSGSALADQLSVIRSTLAGELSPNQSVAAIGGMEAAQAGIRAMMEGRYPGKIIIFPQISGLPLTSISELKTVASKVAERLKDGDVWTRDAESALIETYWKP
jgi:threonine dehydrogenase-like Zn-dependent dehydrogenase